jgi:catechol 2,3-dioxygenase-like lactoylglutathione lyase family enzyme
MQKPEIQSIDHIVMQAADLAATIKFYTAILGMEHSSFQPPTGGPVRQSFAFRIAKDQSA